MAKIFNLFSITIVIVYHVFAETQAASTSKHTSIGSRIVGGTPARNINIPYIVSLFYFYSHHCGGSIINERTVLTAAHCLQNSIYKYFKVHAGTKTISSSREGIVVGVSAVHYHNMFNFKTMDYDIGLVRMVKAISYRYNIQPISLPAPYEDAVQDGDMARVSGWGVTKPGGSASAYLRYANVPIVNQNICDLLHRGITDRMICAGYDNGGADACQSDSGGPLEYDGKIVGIVSWGVSCALPNKPGVYTRVSELIPWIQMTLANNYADSIPGGFFGKTK
ncbi:trypsin-3-like [Eurosta solidaginis]|uniref:trypsin-3-like n=1 Tax=Eurosta solidaginis TaxID=178769 RepID=UPI0035310739